MKKSTSLLVIVSVSLLAIIAVSFLLQSQNNILTDEEKVMKIAVAYIEENYGTDYIINGEVSNQSFIENRPEGETVYNYPTASFRIPSDYFESGQLVNVMVDPDTEEIVKVYSNPCKGFFPYAIDISNWETEVRQGESTSTNITLTSVYTEEEVTVSFSLKLGAYNNIPVGSNYPFPFEAIFEPEQPEPTTSEYTTPEPTEPLTTQPDPNEPEPTEPTTAPFITTEVAIIVAVVVASIIGAVSFYILRKQRK